MAQLMPLSLASEKSRLVLPFWYRLTRVVPDKGPLNGCSRFQLLLRKRHWPADDTSHWSRRVRRTLDASTDAMDAMRSTTAWMSGTPATTSVEYGGDDVGAR